MHTQTFDARTIWLSDVHLGNKDCKAELLLDFLNRLNCDTLYLVGDIVDMWQMSKQFRWPKTHNDVMHKLISLSHSGTRVVFLPGNHDEPLQKYSGMQFGDIEIKREVSHVTANGKRYLVLHGDQFDSDVTLGWFHHWMGDKGYELLLRINRWYNRLRQLRNRQYWSLAGYIKQHIKGANKAISRYRNAACRRAQQRGFDGVICGHIHHPENCYVDDIHYVNDGDWVENCSAVIEDASGSLSLINWTQLAVDVRRSQRIPTSAQTSHNKAA
ncbi:UDP-2,3-diacylglucosamine diphosphatase [Alteromonas oceanisediminis]|uniref:UDP-2,3-diacylglucosamine diphosphatase n=1 Tax=Alteromonas oceanisediminis TaxID=2836180 RepID=UPI001BDB0A18|nr:UDP-2,3-diacylglucosamine diphosphatase [Alteromonas oceanisediminis]MBT0585773.1 UDP-2,3-diacylglucosamine diphosphatase [Alteromonas oceanisediminis]